ncbi:MAG: hypothetical protein D6778_08490 [Nitrospirae bacterium]|nr:MAG: hypothetical protein D6778_08490 [Nitrospirota bacterium]
MNHLYLWAASAGAFIASMTGGLFGVRGLRSKRPLIRFANGFSAGFLISIAIVHLFPESQLEKNYPYALLGFGLFYLIESLTKGTSCADETCQRQHPEKGYLAFAGLSFHSLVDGIAMGFGFGASKDLGVLIALAILVHKTPMGFSLASILLGRGQKVENILRMLFLFSLFTPLGAIMGGYTILANRDYLPLALAFSGGTFLHISISELLPKAHGDDTGREIILYVVLGMATGFLTRLLGH